MMNYAYIFANFLLHRMSFNQSQKLLSQDNIAFQIKLNTKSPHLFVLFMILIR